MWVRGNSARFVWACVGSTGRVGGGLVLSCPGGWYEGGFEAEI